MKGIVLISVLLLSSSVLRPQVNSAQDVMHKWIGSWQGDLEWQKSHDSIATVKMSLIIHPLDSADCYSWNLVYGEDLTDHRGYTLKPVDWRKGHWQIDEHNGIIIDQYLLGNSFVSSFDILGTHIIDEFELINDMMTVRFYSFGTQPQTKTGEGTEMSPTVQAYPLRSLQKVELRRMK